MNYALMNAILINYTKIHVGAWRGCGGRVCARRRQGGGGLTQGGIPAHAARQGSSLWHQDGRRKLGRGALPHAGRREGGPGPTQGRGKEGLVQAAIFSLCRCRLEASKIHFARSKQLLPALSPAPCGGPDVACEALGFFCP